MRWLRRLIPVFLVGLLGLYPLLAPTPHRIDKAHCDLIKAGMTKDDVESIFGAPPGEYDFAEQKPLAFYLAARNLVVKSRFVTVVNLSEGTVQPLSVKQHYVKLWPSDWQTWTSRHGAFTVSFDDEAHVVSTRGPAEVTIVPPWQRWWKKLTGN